MKSDPKPTTLGMESGTLLSPDVDGELLTQGGILKRQACARLQGGPREGKQGR